MVPLIDSVIQSGKYYFGNKTANVPPVTQCSNAEGESAYGRLHDGGIPPKPIPLGDGGSDARFMTDGGAVCDRDDAGPICVPPTTDGGEGMILPDDVTKPIGGPNGEEGRFLEQYPRILVTTGLIDGKGIQNEEVIRTWFGTDSTLITGMPKDPDDPTVGCWPNNIDITPAQTIGGDTQACTEQAGYEAFALCPWWDGASLPLLVDLYRYYCYDKCAVDQTTGEITFGTVIYDTGYLTPDTPTLLGTNCWGNPDANAFPITWPHACYHSDSGRDGTLCGIAELQFAVDAHQVNGASIYQAILRGNTLPY